LEATQELGFTLGWANTATLRYGGGMSIRPYPIGIPGHPWGDQELGEWRARQKRFRSYEENVVARIEAMAGTFEPMTYGRLDYAGEKYTLLALRGSTSDPSRPGVLVTGGVHGYETSGIEGVLEFLNARAAAYSDRINLLAVPCVSPWAYERINRWNFDALDPNRNFRPDGASVEATALLDLVRGVLGGFLAHIDLHETTDSDETEYRPALAARDGESFEPGEIPDGFYLVDDTENPRPEFQQAIVAAVERMTHIAQPDADGRIIGSPMVAKGVNEYPLAQLGLCTSITGAQYTSTTEVYPDSLRTSPAQCVQAQVEAVCAALEFVLARAGARSFANAAE
jgi:hypothetical protein